MSLHESAWLLLFLMDGANELRRWLYTLALLAMAYGSIKSGIQDHTRIDWLCVGDSAELMERACLPAD